MSVGTAGGRTTPEREFRYTINGEPVELCVWAKQVVDPMPPLTETQRARIRALFNVGGEEPQDERS